MYFSNKENNLSFIYNIGIHLVGYGLQFIALFNQKIRKGVVGRSNAFEVLSNTISCKYNTIWFHCASLGEYEQGLPVFKALRLHHKNHKIVLSFFSPSGYEIRKNSPVADVVVYLPLDTKKNAKRFMDLINPELTVFVKYDIWPNYLDQIKQKKLRAILISASFREMQPYFKPYGKILRQALFSFEHIFTQNELSKKLLHSINYDQVTVSGDTRFDRVYSQLQLDNTLDFIDAFKVDKLCVVAGSTWPEGEEILSHYINNNAFEGVKFIVAPHNIKSSQIESLQNKLKVRSVLFSNKDDGALKDAQVFIVDTIGVLSKIYSYSDIAYVGGALGYTGLHNILEPSVFGVPVVIGNNHSKFPEAKAMIENGGVFSISNQHEFDEILNELIENNTKRLKAGKSNSDFVLKNKGAVNQILDFLCLKS